MAPGFLVFLIWSVLICSSSVAKRKTFLGVMFDVPDDHAQKDDATFSKKLDTTRDGKAKLDLLSAWKDYEYVVPLLFAKRRQNAYSNVEVGPGAYKSEIIQYPSDTLKKQLGNLLRLKKKLEERRQT